jgi:hypothetical protein
MDIAKFCIPTFDDDGFSPSLSESMSVPKVVGPPLVEKVRVPWCHVLFTCREGGWSLSPDVKGLGVRRSGTFWWEDTWPAIVPS